MRKRKSHWGNQKHNKTRQSKEKTHHSIDIDIDMDRSPTFLFERNSVAPITTSLGQDVVAVVVEGGAAAFEVGLPSGVRPATPAEASTLAPARRSLREELYMEAMQV